jgi:hypothetical protein
MNWTYPDVLALDEDVYEVLLDQLTAPPPE